MAENAGSSDVFVTCLDAVGGGVLWTRQFGSSSADVGNSVAVGPRGGVFLVGQLGDNEDLSLAAPRAFLAKYDYLGNAQVGVVGVGGAVDVGVGGVVSVGVGVDGVVSGVGFGRVGVVVILQLLLLWLFECLP